MIPLVTSHEMRAAERQAMDIWGMPSLLLQEHAALGALRLIPSGEPIHVMAGPGNNGGDALALARLARLEGREVMVWSPLAEPHWQGDAAFQAALWRGLGGAVHGSDDPERLLASWQGWVVDGFFGLGTTRPLAEPFTTWLRAINESGLPVLALDLPSGLHPDLAEPQGEVLQATMTACFGTLKLCHGLMPARAFCGEIQVVPIPLNQSPTGTLHLLERPLLEPRTWNTHKGHCGHVVIRAGSMGMSGAAVLAALGALRSGAGLVTVLTDAEVRSEVACQVPEAMVQPWMGVLPEGAEVLLVGPGGVDQIPPWKGPLVLDASALGAGEGPRWLERPDTALTPHPGEFARLFSLPRPEGVDERLAQFRQVSHGKAGVLLLKGAQSLIGGGGNAEIWINTTGHPGLATGGSGDFLAGMVAGFRGQNMSMREAVATAVWFHGAAADRLPGAGLLPRDLAGILPELLRG